MLEESNTPINIVTEFEVISKGKPSKEKVRALIARILEEAQKGEQVEVPIRHHFSKGVYGREMSMPKGMLVVGKIHKFQSLNIISKGRVSVLSQDGILNVEAPFSFVSTPGAQRVIFAHEDVVWTTIHGTDETDIEKIEEIFIAKSYDEVPKSIEDEEVECLGQ